MTEEEASPKTLKEKLKEKVTLRVNQCGLALIKGIFTPEDSEILIGILHSEIDEEFEGLVAELENRRTKLKNLSVEADHNGEDLGFLCYIAREDEVNNFLAKLGAEQK